MAEPTPADSIRIRNINCSFQKVSGAIGGAYFEVGKAGRVYRLNCGEKPYALKVFFPTYRTVRNVEISRKLSRYKNIPGLIAADRSVITKTDNPEIINKFPSFEYAVFMPWIEGLSWANFILGKKPINAEESIRLARSFSEVIVALENNHLAHCDLANGNFVFSPSFQDVQLVDLEEMYAPDFSRPDPLPVGSDGYAPESVVDKGYWGEDADRFAGGMLIAEILCWQFSEVRQASAGDTLFASAEFGRDSKRYKLVSQYLGQINQKGANPKELVRLFQKVWNSKTYQECPPLREWQEALGHEIFDHHPILFVEPAHLNFGVFDPSGKHNQLLEPVIRIQNKGDGTLLGKIVPAAWLDIQPNLTFSVYPGQNIEKAVSLRSDCPKPPNGNRYLFPKGLIIDSNGGSKVIGGEYSVYKPKWWILGITLLVVVLILTGFWSSNNFNKLRINALSKLFVTQTSIIEPDPSATPDKKKELVPSETLTRTPTKEPTRTYTPWPSPTPTPTKTIIPQSSILYSENFEDGQVANWTSYVGNWTVQSEGGNHFWDGTGPTDYPQTWLSDNEDGWADYAFESRIRFIKGNIFICLRSPTGGSSFYNAYISQTDNWVSFADYDGKNYQTFGDRSYPILSNTWYTVRFEVQGDSLRLYIDDQLVTAGTRSSHDKGGIGFYMGGGSEVNIDDIKVWSLGSRSTPQPSSDIYSSPQFKVSTYDYQEYGKVNCLICLIKTPVFLTKPGTQSYQVTYPYNKPIYFEQGWCTIDDKTLQSNNQNMDLKIQIDEIDMPVENYNKYLFFDGTLNNKSCRMMKVIITGMKTGPHIIRYTQIFKENINDGWKIYPAGNYNYVYNINITSN